MNLKPKTEKFEERMTVKTTIGIIIEALLKSRIVIVLSQITVMVWCLGSPVGICLY